MDLIASVYPLLNHCPVSVFYRYDFVLRCVLVASDPDLPLASVCVYSAIEHLHEALVCD